MERLSYQDLLDRELEVVALHRGDGHRRSKNRGLTAPELATLMAYTKIVLEDEILDSDLPDDPYLTDRLISYFPSLLRERYAAGCLRTACTGRSSPLSWSTSSSTPRASRASTGCPPETDAYAPDVIRAQIAARAIFDADQHGQGHPDLDYQIDAQMQTDVADGSAHLIERATRWLVNNHARPVDIGTRRSTDDRRGSASAAGAAQPAAGPDHDAYEQRLKLPHRQGADELAVDGAALPPAYAALTIVQTAAREGLDPSQWPRCTSPWASGSGWTGCCRGSSSCPETTGGRRWRGQRCATTFIAHAQLTADVSAEMATAATAPGSWSPPGSGPTRRPGVGQDAALDHRHRTWPDVGGSDRPSGLRSSGVS